MPKFKNSNATFWVIFKQCGLVNLFWTERKTCDVWFWKPFCQRGGGGRKKIKKEIIIKQQHYTSLASRQHTLFSHFWSEKSHVASAPEEQTNNSQHRVKREFQINSYHIPNIHRQKKKEVEFWKPCDIILWNTVCQSSIFCQKMQIFEKLEKWSIFIFVAKLTIFRGTKFKIFEFSRLNWSKIVIS